MKTLAPRDAGASLADLPDLGHLWPRDAWGAGSRFFTELAADAAGQTQALLHNPAATEGVSVKCNKNQLPYFIVWKNRHAECDGYVTGLEPATNFPNTKSFEKQQGRVVPLGPGESATFDIEIEGHPTARRRSRRPGRRGPNCSTARYRRSSASRNPEWSPK